MLRLSKKRKRCPDAFFCCKMRKAFSAWQMGLKKSPGSLHAIFDNYRLCQTHQAGNWLPRFTHDHFQQTHDLTLPSHSSSNQFISKLHRTLLIQMKQILSKNTKVPYDPKVKQVIKCQIPLVLIIYLLQMVV